MIEFPSVTELGTVSHVGIIDASCPVMTVSKLIEILQKMPGDLEVWTDYDCIDEPVTQVVIKPNEEEPHTPICYIGHDFSNY